MSAVRKALDAYHGSTPDWVMRLAQACDETSQNRVAKTLDVSAAQVSTVLNNRYTGNTANLERNVRGRLMNASVTCPMLGNIGIDACWDYQANARNPVNLVAMTARMVRACRKCPRYTEKENT